MHYLVPRDLAEAIRFRHTTGFPVLAGGTDLYPAIEHGLRLDGFIDISAVTELRGPIRCIGNSWVIPALTTWSAVISAKLPPQFDALKQAAAQVGGRQIQNTGTVGGNICNASPAADGAAVLLALDASVLIAGISGKRELPLATFICGNRRTALKAGELVEAIRVPARKRRHASTFKKLGARRYLVISIVMVCAVIEIDEDGCIQWAAISVGACADRPLRLEAVERRMLGAKLGAISQLILTDAELALLAPIDDIRGSGLFRRAAAKALVEEALQEISEALMT